MQQGEAPVEGARNILAFLPYAQASLKDYDSALEDAEKVGSCREQQQEKCVKLTDQNSAQI
jgi:hypothetical protein